MIGLDIGLQARVRVTEASLHCRQAEKDLLDIMAVGDATTQAIAIEKHEAAQRSLAYSEALEMAIHNRLALARSCQSAIT